MQTKLKSFNYLTALNLIKINKLFFVFLLLLVPAVAKLAEINQRTVFKDCPDFVIQRVNLVKAGFYENLELITKTDQLPSKTVSQVADLVQDVSNTLLRLSNIETIQKEAATDPDFKALIDEATKGLASTGQEQQRAIEVAKLVNNCSFAVTDVIEELNSISQIYTEQLTIASQSAIVSDYLSQFNSNMQKLVDETRQIESGFKKLNNNFRCFQTNCVTN